MHYLPYFWTILITLALLINIILFWSFKKKPSFFGISILSASLFMLALYFLGGNSALLNHYFTEQKKSQDVQKMLTHFKNSEEIIEAMKKAITKNNQSSEEKAKGYYLLGRLYRTEKKAINNPEALSAFQKAYQLEPTKFAYAFEYLQSLYATNHQQHTALIVQLMRELEKQNSNNPELLDFLGYDAYIHGNTEKAVEYWEKLLPYLSESPETRKAILLAIGKAQKKLVK